MIARQLEAFLRRQVDNVHISTQPNDHISKRFDNLRRYNLLPKGRIKNSQHLTHEEIVSSILSIISPEVGYAGMTALILKDLRPVGGTKASFQNADTFSHALEAIFANPNVLDKIIKVTISDSEVYKNSYGRAAIYYRHGKKDRVAYYVDKHAHTLLKPGADKDYNPSEIIAPVISERAIYPSFFHQLVRSLALEASMPPITYPEEPDTDEETEKKRRERYLKLTRHSNFLNLAVDCQVTWPKDEKLVQFDGYNLVLLPKTKDYTTSIHIDLHGNRVTHAEARTIINRFLSLLTWCDDQYAVLQEGFSGNPSPAPMPKRELAFSTAYQWEFYRALPNEDGSKAVAIYREGRNAEQNFLVSYAVLSYYKIIEIRYKGNSEARTWFRDSYNVIREKVDPNIITRFENYCGDKSVEKYLLDECRAAVAHANKPKTTDPDEAGELQRLHNVAYILRYLSRHFIITELEVSEHYCDGS